MLEVANSFYNFFRAVRLGNEQASRWDLLATRRTVAGATMMFIAGHWPLTEVQ